MGQILTCLVSLGFLVEKWPFCSTLVWTHEDAPLLGSASLALQGAVLASAVLKNSAIVVKIPYARTDP